MKYIFFQVWGNFECNYNKNCDKSLHLEFLSLPLSCTVAVSVQSKSDASFFLCSVDIEEDYKYCCVYWTAGSFHHSERGGDDSCIC